MHRTSATYREACQLGTLPTRDIGCIMINEVAAEDKQGFEGLGLLTRPVEVDDVGLDEAGTLAGGGGMLG